MRSYYEVRGTPFDTGVPVTHNMQKRTNAVKKAQAMMKSCKFYFITIRKAGQYIMDFNGQI